jgi:hypothetical protein
MANVAGNVLVGKPATTGGVLIADTGVTVPTDATTALAGGFVASGYISEDGVVQSIAADVTKIKAWGGDIVRAVQTSHDVTYAFTLLETNDASLAAYYGAANYTPGTTRVVAGDMPHKEFVFEIADGTSKIRIVIPNGQVTERGDVTYKDDTAVGGQLTVTAYPDASGVKAYIYTSGVPAGSSTSVPVLTSVNPATSTTAGGALVVIRGVGFTGVTGATGVKFGGTNASSYQVINDNEIAAITPAKTAGSQTIVVTNAAGASNALAFTYA